MENSISVSGSISESELTMSMETGKLANLAHGAVFAEVGETAVLATAVMSKAREGTDFFPLTVDIEERMYAAGKVPGSFFRREGRPSELAILTARLIDRPLRPVFPEDFREEVQIVVTVMGADQKNPHDILALNAASAALAVSGIPFDGPVGAVHLSYIDGTWVANGTYEQRNDAIFEIVVAGRKITNPKGEEDIAIMMVEAGGNENTVSKYESGIDKVTETVLGKALEYSKQWIKAAIDVQEKLVAEVIAKNGPIKVREYTPNVDYQKEVLEKLEVNYTKQVVEALEIVEKEERSVKLKEILDVVIAEYCGNKDADLDNLMTDGTSSSIFAGRESEVAKAFSSFQKKLIRAKIINEGIRMDGRSIDQIRPLSAEVSVLKSTHGTGLFQRGETQVLSVATLGMPNMKQTLDTIGVDVSKRYMHHYNFPPSSVGEVGRVGSPKRREIGHGALAERALIPVLPSEENWPYTMRVVSDVLASNGSTSMASVCGSTLSLMDAGVPIAAQVAGIAMGLVYEDDKYVTLTDIQGAEDAFGDMDFKVAGTAEYVTALQLDTKIDGIPADVLASALEQAKVARLTILDVINKTLNDPRKDVGKNAPKITRIEVPEDKVGEIIGPKGKMINAIQESTGADIAVDTDGEGAFVIIGSSSSESVNQALEAIDAIVNPAEPEVGVVYEGTVVSITKYGAFVNIMPGRDGLVHISQLGSEDERVINVDEYLKQDEKVEVKIISIDDRGKISLELANKVSKNDSSKSAEPKENKSKPAAKETPKSNDKGGKRKEVSFEDFFSSELKAEFGDLGPSQTNERNNN